MGKHHLHTYTVVTGSGVSAQGQLPVLLPVYHSRDRNGTRGCPTCYRSTNLDSFLCFPEKVREIQEKLEAFIEALHKEK